MYSWEARCLECIWTVQNATTTIVLSKRPKNATKDNQKCFQIPPKSISRDHPKARKRSNTSRGVNKTNFADRSPRQSGQRAPKRGPKNLPKPTTAAQKRFEDAAKRLLGSGNLGKPGFFKMYYTESRFLELPSSPHNRLGTCKSIP